MGPKSIDSFSLDRAMGADLIFPSSAQLVLTSIFQLFLFTYDPHQLRRIWKLPTAFDTADVIGPGAATLRPSGVYMDAVK
jgi:hypothetical protein